MPMACSPQADIICSLGGIKLDQKNNNVFTLYADNTRLSPAVDPDARQFMASQGTFLEYVRIAGEELGYKVDIELFPEGEYDEGRLEESMDKKPVAQLTLSRIGLTGHPLYQYMFQPDTNRGPYDTDLLTVPQLKELQSINDDKDLAVELFQDPENMKLLSGYAKAAADVEAGVGSVMKESAEIFRANGGRRSIP